MYKILNNDEIQEFTKKYFKEWGSDINRVSVLEYNNKYEYLINNHYLFIIGKN